MALRLRATSFGARCARGAAGFTMVQIVVTLAVIAVVTSFALVQIAVARDHMTLASTARSFAAYTEKARLDSVRRHGALTGGQEASVKLNSTTRYTALFDHDYNGTPTNHDYPFPEGVTVTSVEVTTGGATVTKVPSAADTVTITFDWRGRTTSSYRINFTNTRGHAAVVGITSAGEVSLDRESVALASGSYAAIFGDTGSLGPLSSTPTPTPELPETEEPTDPGGDTTDPGGDTTDPGGDTTDPGGGTGDTGDGNNGGGNDKKDDGGGGGGGDGGDDGDTGGGSTDGGSTGGTNGPCSMSLSPSSSEGARIPVSNSGNSTLVVTATLSNAPSGSTITAAEQTIALTHMTVSVSGSTITIDPDQGQLNRGNFTVKVTPPSGCGDAQFIYISVVK